LLPALFLADYTINTAGSEFSAGTGVWKITRRTTMQRDATMPLAKMTHRSRKTATTLRISFWTIRQVAEVCRKMGISEATFYRWKQLYGGLLPSEVKRLRQVEEENARLRKVVADRTLDKEMLQEVIRRKL
jgi:putative transposase